jgi:hypothetical protein
VDHHDKLVTCAFLVMDCSPSTAMMPTMSSRKALKLSIQCMLRELELTLDAFARDYSAKRASLLEHLELLKPLIADGRRAKGAFLSRMEE